MGRSRRSTVATPPLRPAARLALLAAAACVLLALPVSAGAHAGHSHDAVDDPSGFLDVLLDGASDRQLAVLDAAAQRAPEAVNGQCTATIEVAGQGSSCRADGQWLVRAPGADLPTHGPDVVAGVSDADVVGSLSPAAQTAVDGASAADISCAPNDRMPQYRAIYARPVDGVFDATAVARVRQELYRASAYLNQQAGQDAPGRTAKLRLKCSGGVPVVTVVVLPTAGSATTFATIAAELRAQGHNSPAPRQDKYIVYYGGRVGPAPLGFGGQAERWLDSKPGATNENGKQVGAIAVDYDDLGEGPSWSTMLHEIVHTQGGVQDDAPTATGQGHCNSTLDIMCYVDGGPTNQTLIARCATDELDCQGDTYFHAGTPAGGSYLATHWNVGSPLNRWIDHGALDRDLTPPSAPGMPVVDSRTVTTLAIGWSTSIDDRAVSVYRVERFYGLQWNIVATTNASAFTVTGMNPGTEQDIRIVAVDAAGRESIGAPLTTSTLPDTTAPARPPMPYVTNLTTRGVTVEWEPATDDVEVTQYRVSRRLGDGTLQLVAQLGGGTTSATVPTAVAGEQVTIVVHARDAAGNTSVPSFDLVTFAAPDTQRPTHPTAETLPAIGTTTATLRWSAATDDEGVTGYIVERVFGTIRGEVARTAQLQYDLTGLTPGTAYHYDITALDAAGNRSAEAAVIEFTTGTGTSPGTQRPGSSTGTGSPPAIGGPSPFAPTIDGALGGQPPAVAPPAATPPAVRDRSAPTRPTKLRATWRTRSSIVLGWAPSTDNVGVTGYRVSVVNAAGTWKLLRVVTAPRAKSVAIPKLRPGASYRFSLEAVDAAGNRSPRSAVLRASTLR